MKKIVATLLLLGGLSAFYVSDNNVKTFKRLYTLQGTWKMTTERGVVCEEWKKIARDTLQGKGYMIRNKDTIITENILLTYAEKGGIVYTSTVEDQNNKQPAAFKLTRQVDNSFFFENPAHDFPKRIVYRFVTFDSIHAFIDDGTATGKKQNFYYKRQ